MLPAAHEMCLLSKNLSFHVLLLQSAIVLMIRMIMTMFLVIIVVVTWKCESQKSQKKPRMQIKMQLYFVFCTLGNQLFFECLALPIVLLLILPSHL